MCVRTLHASSFPAVSVHDFVLVRCPFDSPLFGCNKSTFIVACQTSKLLVAGWWLGELCFCTATRIVGVESFNLQIDSHNLLEMEVPFYHGPISKQACEILLMRRGKNGSYLLRDSETIPGVFCLSILSGRLIYTYRIYKTSNGFYRIQTAEGVKEKLFKDIYELVANYEKPNQGVAQCLLHPVKVEITSQCSIDHTGFRTHSEEIEDTYAEVDDREYVHVFPS
uniref:SH2 domain-containing protein n=1 Tax=Leptobrachium leishanense TaxID=445787 RepID=A0A8C5LLC3_9ANUR